MNRTDFQKLSEIRIRETKFLFENGFYEGAYYLAGYAIECALKACISKQIREHDFPDRNFITESYTHNLDKLLGLSGLREEHRKKSEDSDFSLNWAVVKDWSEKDRYTTQIEKQKAKDIIEAITDKEKGVLSWLKNCW